VNEEAIARAGLHSQRKKSKLLVLDRFASQTADPEARLTGHTCCKVRNEEICNFKV
jgi:hypothetical protein